MPRNGVIAKKELDSWKKSIKGWRNRLQIENKKLIEGGLSKREAARVLEPSASFCLGIEEEIKAYEKILKKQRTKATGEK
jgi:hypothetical protein